MLIPISTLRLFLSVIPIPVHSREISPMTKIRNKPRFVISYPWVKEFFIVSVIEGVSEVVLLVQFTRR